MLLENGDLEFVIVGDAMSLGSIPISLKPTSIDKWLVLIFMWLPTLLILNLFSLIETKFFYETLV